MKKAKIEKMSRAPMERIRRIRELIASKTYPNAEGMSVALEVSSKTLKRDIEFMRDRLKLPIGYEPVRHGYFFTKPLDESPSVTLTEPELFALLVAEKAITAYEGTPFVGMLRTAFARLTGQLDGKTQYTLGGLQDGLSFRPFAPKEMDLELFQVISQAVRERRTLRRNTRSRRSEKFSRDAICIRII